MFFFKKNKDSILESIYSPVDGVSSSLESINDDFFSQGMLGYGVIIKPNIIDGKVRYYAPVSGVLESLQHTGNGYGIRSTKGVPVLLHIGLETKILDGQGFKSSLVQGQKVEVGDLLVEVDVDYLKSMGASEEAIIVITNGMKIALNSYGEVKVGNRIFDIK